MKRSSAKETKEVEDTEKSLTKIIRENYAWIIAILTLGTVIVSNILKFIEYLTSLTYFQYYGLDHNLYNYYDKNFIYSICLSVVFLIAFGFLLYCMKEIKDDFKNNLTLKNISIIVLANLYLTIVYCSNLSNTYKLINFVAFILLEYISSIFIFKKNDDQKVNKKNRKKFIIDYFKSLVFLIILLILCNSARLYINLQSLTNYRIINDNKVIVYSTNNYYITLDCEINDNQLTIYKGSQEKIENNNIKSQLTKFNKVEIKE